MATCKDCIHYELCEMCGELGVMEAPESYIPHCMDFINKADVVPVVRCYQCKHWNNGDCYRLELSRPDDYCSYGERKD